MTKAELIKALEGINDDAEVITFIYEQDRDGWPTQYAVTIKEVADKDAYLEARKKALEWH